MAVEKDLEYAKVLAKKDDRETLLWIAEPLVKAVLKKGRCKDYSILETKKGAEAAGWRYESPLASSVPLQRDIDHKVLSGDFVTLENTGDGPYRTLRMAGMIVLGTKEGLAIVCPVDGAGKFKEEAGIFAGQFVRISTKTFWCRLAITCLQRRPSPTAMVTAGAARRRSSSGDIAMVLKYFRDAGPDAERSG